MKFRTEIVPRSDWAISHHDQLFFIGSCFAEEISERLRRVGFDIEVNPFGILFNPISIAAGLHRIIETRYYQEREIMEFRGLYHTWDHHGSFKSWDKDQLLFEVNQSLDRAFHKLKNADYLVVTLGSAWVYALANNQVVANCHKYPSQTFQKRLLSIDEIRPKWEGLLANLAAINPKIKVLFTISPVRYLKDGFLENQMSKSTLFLALNALMTSPHISYFPAYEIMQDDLRDYRWYDKDLVHPSAIAIDYIFEKFTSTFFNEDTIKIIDRMNQLNNLQAHRILFPDTPEAELHKNQIKDLRIKLQNDYPFLHGRF